MSKTTPNRSRRRASLLPAVLLGTVVLGGAAGLNGCRLEMYDESRVKPYEQSTVFADSMTARPHIPGTIPVDGRRIGAPDAELWDTTGSMIRPAAQTGTGAVDTAAGTDTTAGGGRRTAAVGTGALPTADQIRAASIPFRVTRAELERGRDRYRIFCTPCHGATGEGDGMIVQRGFPKPPSFHLERLRIAADGHFYDVISNGFGMMYRYDYRIKPHDRWAITAYIRALQLSRDARPENLPSADTAAVR